MTVLSSVEFLTSLILTSFLGEIILLFAWNFLMETIFSFCDEFFFDKSTNQPDHK